MNPRTLVVALAMGCRASASESVDPEVPAEVVQRGCCSAPPVVNGDALVLVYDEPPAAEAASVRFVLFADGPCCGSELSAGSPRGSIRRRQHAHSPVLERIRRYAESAPLREPVLARLPG